MKSITIPALFSSKTMFIPVTGLKCIGKVKNLLHSIQTFAEASKAPSAKIGPDFFLTVIQISVS